MMCDDDPVIWPSALPPCSVSIAWAQALQIAMAQQIDKEWRQTPAEGFAFKEIDWTPTKPTHRKGGPLPTAMTFEPQESET
jgi:hypothetical protein